MKSPQAKPMPTLLMSAVLILTVAIMTGCSDDEITELNIPTGVPLVYDLDEHFHPSESKPVTERYLMDAAAVQARADAVARQASGG